MTPKRYWVLVRSGKWHAWYVDGQHSVCNLTNAQDLRETPPVRIEEELTPVHRVAVCRICARKVGLPPLETPLGVAGAWVGFLRRFLGGKGVRAAEGDLGTLAALLQGIGGYDSPEGQAAFQEVQVLLLTPKVVSRVRGRVTTLSAIHDALNLMQSVPDGLARVVKALQVFRRETAGGIGRFKPAQVVEVMLQIPDPEAYLRHLKTQGFDGADFLGSAFHPNVLARAKKAPGLRGTFSGSPDYWQATRDQLHIVEE